jgi:acyl phosphate:glycerol-3-phosphate acyltransferase
MGLHRQSASHFAEAQGWVIYPIVGLVGAYLLGSIPAAHIAGKLRGVDLRQHGSGNLGATNAFRVLGKWTGTAVMLFDAAKGAVPVIFFPALTGVPFSVGWALGFGIAAIVGHVRPIFLLGKGGGKGVATASGVFFALAWLPMLFAFMTWTGVLLASGYVSLASLAAAVVLPLALLATAGPRNPVFIAALLIAAFVFWSHRSNITRLRNGTEHRFGRKGAKQGDAAPIEAAAAHGNAAAAHGNTAAAHGNTAAAVDHDKHRGIS